MKPAEAMEIISLNLLKKEFTNAEANVGYMDAFGWNKSTGECCEIEIKVADYDFNKEFTNASKIEKHEKYKEVYKNNDGYNFCPTRFYFFVLRNLETKALRRIKKNNLPYGLITFNPMTLETKVVRKSEKLTSWPLGVYSRKVVRALFEDTK